MNLIITLLAGASMAPGVVCPVMGHSPAEAGGFSDWNGLHVAYCCAGCESTFESDPFKFMKAAAEDGTVVAAGLYDPVSRTRVKREDNELYSDYKGVRFYFVDEANKATFQEEPKKYGKLPKKEVFYCSVMDHGLESYVKAGAYADYEEVRYYFCCPACQAKFDEDPEQYVEAVENKVEAPGVADPKEDS
jgi:YHS domain-containing protein